jgi:large subunit ribosomal protein L30
LQRFAVKQFRNFWVKEELIMAKVKITLTRSLIGRPQDQRATVRALGLGKINSTVEQEDNAVIRGMIFKVKHLVKVEEI